MTRAVLCVAAHPDDEVLGAGGTLAKHAAAGHEVTVLVVTEGTTAQYDDESLIEQKREEARACAERLGVADVRFGDLPDMRLDTVAHVEVNAVIEAAVDDVEPDVVYTHSPHDVNKDHAALAESTRVATRPGSGVERVLAYEVPSSTGWAGGDSERFQPTTYVEVTDYIDRKVEAFEAYGTETREYPHPRSERAIRALGDTRGTEAGFEVAEAFQLVSEYRREL
ncbi:PIG-L deacetylase family protein [Haloarcula salinisoli]|uniref:PIG-L family deacetylase n=1 Tax=Haloarcula salinisoli TaxID=2487746 RepID=A0A8J7YH57_9EURY|nr:PIG-L deacetylase family protein [Halomicroarcula salinisoli]MBX0288255.1 PIG-L family deacetylase [Halomicroarcula salinisoli]MBX0305417.1 PIG-L family deacetylase [Halomicroarcula salinisoli]